MFKNQLTPEVFITDERFEDEQLIVDSVSLRNAQDSTNIYVESVRGTILRKSMEKQMPSSFLTKLYNYT